MSFKVASSWNDVKFLILEVKIDEFTKKLNELIEHVNWMMQYPGEYGGVIEKIGGGY